MNIEIMVEPTPNPNALKFVLNQVVKANGRVTYKSAEECANVPLAAALFKIEDVNLVHFFDNVITVGQNPTGHLLDLDENVRHVILEEFPKHDPNFSVETFTKKIQMADSADVQIIEDILDQTIRPALRADGGDLEIVNFKDNVLTVYYQGACGSCPSSKLGTLGAIQNILRNEYNPEIEVVTQD